jgi:radical SAM superfamily enzyme YgiQ (UPF0313 family)
MIIGLIAMSGVRVRTQELAELGVTLPGFVNRGEVVASLPSLGLLTVAALTPKDVEVEYIEIDQLPKDKSELQKFDLVGISSFTARINAAYKLADMYMELGIPVVLGGIHVSLMPEEAQNHADSIVLYGAEGAWPKLTEDFKKGQMKPRYEGLKSDVFSPENYVVPRFDFIKGRSYNRITIQTSRGCPLNCEFCAASLRITSKFQQKPIELVVNEIEKALEYTEHPFFEFADDNTFVNKKWGKDFLKAIIPLNINWFTETDISVADDDELLDLMAKSGCRQILIGFESPSADGLQGMNPNDWKLKRHKSYIESINKIQSKGVSVNGCFIVGLDSDTLETFNQIKQFADEAKLIEIQITVYTPFPGTPLYHRLKNENRLLQDENWDRCTLFDVNFKPKNMSLEQLEDGIKWLFKNLYNEDEFLKRKRYYMEYIKNIDD